MSAANDNGNKNEKDEDIEMPSRNSKQKESRIQSASKSNSKSKSKSRSKSKKGSKRKTHIKAADKPITKQQMKTSTIITPTTTTLADTRVSEHPGHSLIKRDGVPYCQCCDHALKTDKTSVKRHCKESKTHERNLKAWTQKSKSPMGNYIQTGIRDSISKAATATEMRNDSLLAGITSGVSAVSICRYNKMMQSKNQFPNGAGLVTHEASLVYPCAKKKKYIARNG